MEGIICPVCGCDESVVLQTRNIESGIRRRRECKECFVRWNTFEYSETSEEDFFKQKTAIVAATTDAKDAIRDAIEALQKIQEKWK